MWIWTPKAAAAATVFLATTQAWAADPTTVECIAASEKSLALGGQNKLRSARDQLLICVSASCPTDIRKECGRRVDEVNVAIPTIVFRANDPTGNELSSVKVTMDGEVVAEKLAGTAIALDPGPHTFTFETQGQPALTRQILVHEAEKERHEVVQFGPSRPSLPAQQPSASSAPVASAVPPSSPLPPEGQIRPSPGAQRVAHRRLYCGGRWRCRGRARGRRGRARDRAEEHTLGRVHPWG